MRKERTWFGVDANNETSLFEYGFLMRYRKNGEYEVIYLYGFGQDGSPLFCYGIFSPESWRKDFTESLGKGSYPNAQGIAECAGMDASEWLEVSKENPCGMLADMLGYYPNADIFGENAWGDTLFTEQQIRQRLNRALA